MEDGENCSADWQSPLPPTADRRKEKRPQAAAVQNASRGLEVWVVAAASGVRQLAGALGAVKTPQRRRGAEAWGSEDGGWKMEDGENCSADWQSAVPPIADRRERKRRQAAAVQNASRGLEVWVVAAASGVRQLAGAVEGAANIERRTSNTEHRTFSARSAGLRPGADGSASRPYLRSADWRCAVTPTGSWRSGMRRQAAAVQNASRESQALARAPARGVRQLAGAGDARAD